jgi:transposase-like protein
MEDFPDNALEFADRFTTESACLKYLEKVRWPDGYRCMRCGSADYWKKRGRLFRCKKCFYEGNVTRGTLFQDTRKPLMLWFQAMWYVVNQKNGVSALGLQKVLGLGSYQTAWEWLHKLRRAMVRPGRDKLSGMVEVDETIFGGLTKGKHGRGIDDKSLIFIAAEEKPKGIGRIRCLVIKNASAAMLLNAVNETISKGSTVKTDGWSGYNMLTENGYTHLRITHPSAESGDATPLVHRAVSLFKRWWMGTHQGAISHENLQYYLDEFTFRFNRRNSRSRGKLFYRLVEQALQIDPVPAKTLKHNI